jgi:photosystem II Psb27 protein
LRRALSLSLSVSFERQFRAVLLVSRGSLLSIFGSLFSLFAFREVVRRRVKGARRECECDIFLLFLLFLYQKLTSKRFIFRQQQTTKALALFGIGEKSDAKYEEDTMAVIAQVREVLDFPMGAEGREQSIEKTRALTNEWVARYRRSGDYSGRPSYGLTYSALNAVSGHFNNFGTKYPFPAKRKDRVFEELTSAETQISRGR